ncbi:forespore capture DNA-binding protein RefZ [Brevibacillus humidisoli]|uniref:forespore capture DNA-binding protein RefZ n=1 Tax=Brevibacillus humidisoli TaxID=2895522 RepID=UPI001E2B08E1|nr:forespore capture DNA-binding protein RefZ [Brevibacillus humidisoli]UFJ41569.1 forespore capture DNA-binding protein RefZ [Brevibacillus humidisoli]
MKRVGEPSGKGTDQTKARILAAAAKLFDAQGFDGTTVRQIAKEADVNLALISYYFNGKRGLLEVLIASYYETFFRLLSEQKAASPQLDPLDELLAVVRLYVFFQRDHAAVTRLIQRELSVESMLAREVMTVYIHRWKHIFSSILEEGISRNLFVPLSVDQVLLAMTSLLVYPYLNLQAVREVYYLEPGSDEFCEWLVASVEQLFRSLLIPLSSPSSPDNA